MVAKYILDEIQELKEFLNNTTAGGLYSHLVVFCTDNYYVELNPLYIQSLKVNGEYLELRLQNNRLMNLKLTDDFNYKRIKSVNGKD